MPAIAADAAKYHPAFYWHLGDLRAIYEIDEDYAGEMKPDGTVNTWEITAYINAAWDDAIRMQIKPFEDHGIPFLIGIGNHETILPKTRDQFIARFADWLDSQCCVTSVSRMLPFRALMDRMLGLFGISGLQHIIT
jgi:hypothetical protein